MESVLALDKSEIENKNEKDVNNLAVEMLREVCEERGYEVKLCNALPEFYIWLDKEEGIINISLDAQEYHVIEFMDSLNAYKQAS